MIVPDTKWQPSLEGAGRSKYKSLAQAIREGIVSRQLQEGEQLPPVRELAYRIGVTPGTVARAYALLTDEGRLIAGVGRGTFVAGRATRPQSVLEEPLLLDPVLARPERAHLLSPKVPDMGQGRLIADALRRLADGISPLDLLTYPTRETDLPARAAFRDTLDRTPLGAFDLDDIVTSHGGQSGLVMILQTILHGASPVIAVDELCYGGFRSASMLCRAQVVSVPWDDDGPDADAFEALVKTRGVQVFCTSAEVCNPTVKTTTVARRKEIARIAQRYGVHVIDDDCYRLMQSEPRGPSYRALLPDLGWYVNSPSKSLSSALRIGFVVGPREWSAPLVRTSTFHSFGVSRLITDVYADVMGQAALPQILSDIQARIAQDVRGAVNVLGGHRISWSEHVPFLMVDLPRGWRAGAFCQAAEAENVLLKSVDDFALRDARSPHAVRIAINGEVAHGHFLEALRKVRVLLDNPPEEISV